MEVRLYVSLSSSLQYVVINGSIYEGVEIDPFTNPNDAFKYVSLKDCEAFAGKENDGGEDSEQSFEDDNDRQINESDDVGGQLFIDTSDDHSEDFVDQDKDSEDENEGRMHLCVKDDEPAVNSHRPPTPGTGQRNDYVRGEKERRGTSNTKRTIPSRLNHTRRVAIDARVTFFFSRVLPRRY